VRVNRAGWASGPFLAYTGALLALVASAAWLAVISADHGKGAFAGWSVLFYVVAEILAFGLLRRGRKVVAGLFAFVGLGLFAVMIGAFFSWFGWLPDDKPLGGFHVGLLALQLLVLMAAATDTKIFRFPLFSLVTAGLGWYFVTDVLSSGGNWSAVVTLLFGGLLFFTALAVDSGDSRPYGFWIHVVAGVTVGAALLYWWHSSDFQWALIIVVALIFIGVGAALRRSSYAVLGTVGLLLATSHYALHDAFAVTNGDVSEPSRWQGPVAFLCLGLFLALLGMWLWPRREDAADPAL
jgi:hypothetical protein